MCFFLSYNTSMKSIEHCVSWIVFGLLRTSTCWVNALGTRLWTLYFVAIGTPQLTVDSLLFSRLRCQPVLWIVRKQTNASCQGMWHFFWRVPCEFNVFGAQRAEKCVAAVRVPSWAYQTGVFSVLACFLWICAQPLFYLLEGPFLHSHHFWHLTQFLLPVTFLFVLMERQTKYPKDEQHLHFWPLVQVLLMIATVYYGLHSHFH